MFPLRVDLGRGFDEVLHPAAAQVAAEKSVRVVQVADHLLEPGEVSREFRVQRGLGIEEGRHRGIFDGAYPVGVAAAGRNGNDVLVTENFQPGLRERLPQQRHRRQRQEKIADGTAANDEYFWLQETGGVAIHPYRNSMAESSVDCG